MHDSRNFALQVNFGFTCPEAFNISENTMVLFTYSFNFPVRKIELTSAMGWVFWQGWEQVPAISVDIEHDLQLTELS